MTDVNYVNTLRAALAALAAASALALATPCTASAGADTPTVELFGVVSGFAKARTDRTTIMVGPIPANAEVDLGLVLGEWNRAAGWNLYGLADSDATADVTFASDAPDKCPNYGACVNWDQFPTGWYEHCYVSIWPWKMDPNVIEHELGHCLGFVDVPEGLDPYHGIMSYQRDRTTLTLGEQDIASLTAVSYRDVTATVEG